MVLAPFFMPLCARLAKVQHRPVIFASAPDFRRFMMRAKAGGCDTLFLNPYLYRRPACTEVSDAEDIHLDQGSGDVDLPLFGQMRDLASLKEMERRYLAYLLERTQRNQTKAAEILQVGKNTVWRRVRDSKAV